jgi:hypothetical protein
MKGLFLVTASRPALDPPPPPRRLPSGCQGSGVKQRGLDSDHSPPSCAEVKNAWIYTSTPPWFSMLWGLFKEGIRMHSVIVKRGGQLYILPLPCLWNMGLQTNLLCYSARMRPAQHYQQIMTLLPPGSAPPLPVQVCDVTRWRFSDVSRGKIASLVGKQTAGVKAGRGVELLEEGAI